jgi:hypothetical protein
VLGWAGIVSSSLAWVFLLPYYHAVPWLGWSLFAVGLAAVCAASAAAAAGTATGRGPGGAWLLFRSYALCALPLAALAVLMPFPEGVGAAVLAVGLALSALPARFRWPRALGAGLAFSGLVSSVHSIWLPAHVMLESRFHHVSLFEPIVKLVLSAFGLDAALGGRGLLVKTAGYQFTLSTTLEKLNFLAFALVLLGGLAAILIDAVVCAEQHQRPFRRAAGQALRLAGILAAYFGARYVLLILLMPTVRNLNIFWRPEWTLGTLVPLMLVPVPRLVGLWQTAADPPRQHARGAASRRPSVSSRLILAVCCFALVAAVGFHDPGTPKPGRVLIDEYHSSWEKTTEPYTTEWYGEDSGYNYYSLASYMEDYYTVSRNLDSPITTELLADTDVLMLKTPTSAYAADEIEAVVEFVRRGGGLLLVGDHTNVFGTSTYLNPIAERFGLHYNHDGTYDLDTDGLSIYEDRSMFTHPTVRRLGRFLFATSCSLDAPLWAAGAITGYGIKALYLDYSKENFFRTDAPDFDKDYGLILQQVALTRGQGRVVAFTDSTVWSNFFMFIPGKWELAEGALDWLNRTNRFIWVPWLLVAVALAGAGVLVWRHRVRGATIVDPIGVALALVLAVGAIMAVRWIDTAAYPPPAKIAHGTAEVAFERDHGNMLIPSETIFIDSGRAYHVFYTWTQRVSARPRVAPLAEAVECDIVVLPNIATRFEPRELDLIRGYVESGGRLLVLHGNGSDDTAANEVLGMFGLSVEDRRDAYLMNLKGGLIPRPVASYSVTGGTPLVYDNLGRPAAAVADVGTAGGRVMVFAASSLFSDAVMGTTSTIPDEVIRSIYDLEFHLINIGMEGRRSP